MSDNVLGESDGTVKWFNNQKGFGFIEPDGGGPDAFAHFRPLKWRVSKRSRKASA